LISFSRIPRKGPGCVPAILLDHAAKLGSNPFDEKAKQRWFCPRRPSDARAMLAELGGAGACRTKAFGG
jgi:hypothetical protein